MLPFVVLQFILLVLFVPETSYRRDAIYDIDTSSALDLAKLGQLEKRARAREVDRTRKGDSSNGSSTDGKDKAVRVDHGNSYRVPPPPKTFWQSMALYTGTYTEDSIAKMVLSSIVIVANLGASWVIFTSGLLVAWYVAISFVSSPLLYQPPYSFNAASVGYTSVGPLIGGVLGSAFCSVVMDPMLKWLTKMNKGV
jgi:hypothetical protein